ncbi:hypothetical protein W97_07960 [Coniosporium apollinis CBS 100218]|uniref:F5/8 type C domain-containing protein n=1 Tax=Coniosporium apollinis (strain CBS 100218) TaxID=1168221 RepID=R7Z3G6_CONA1|nr:uncharacterized protein W97_07960 [Coniosporium apollinis CBS 100218]EON68702.1 hypothetical protein W97_07960 [Coniosporium apollinis CBS 100218]
MAMNAAFRLLLLSALLFAEHTDALAQDSVEEQVLEADVPIGHGARIGLMEAAPPRDPSSGRPSAEIDRSTWVATCDSEAINHTCSYMIDKDVKTFWQSAESSVGAALPQNVTIDMGDTRTFHAISMLPSDDPHSRGNIAAHEVYISQDNQNWGTPVAYGTWWNDNTVKYSIFEPKQARYIRLVARSEASGTGDFVSIATFSVYGVAKAPTSGLGRWGPTIDFPIVPAGAWVDPLSGRVVTFSSYAHEMFRPLDPRLGNTMTRTWDPATRLVSQRTVQETGHDMFCPGMSLNATGYMHVTGGNSAKRTSIYGINAQGAAVWTPSAEMNVPRGYQSSVTCADGRIFVIGGSFGIPCDPPGPEGEEKNGELYDPVAKTWTEKPRCKVKPMFTDETSTGSRECRWFRSDNHGWLFPWKDNTVFQAGPSKRMNWYNMSGLGDVQSAGKRSDDNDAMCGVAVMYDAAQGSILTAGGSPQYTGLDATNRAYLLTIKGANAPVEKERTTDMANPRIYHSAVILPNGDTLVVGGRRRGQVFNDDEAVLVPEVYSPTLKAWTNMANHSIPRTYHSLALLLPDGTVFVGGGGLCEIRCNANHFDAQIFTPPYLLTASGDLSVRPVIKNISASDVLPGNSLTIDTDSAVQNASIVRYGSATHGLNTDQRRIPLTMTPNGPNRYDVTIPAEKGIAIPGYWMLFVMDAQGVPSVAMSLQVKVA